MSPNPIWNFQEYKYPPWAPICVLQKSTGLWAFAKDQVVSLGELLCLSSKSEDTSCC